jgi:HSP20 family protein
MRRSGSHFHGLFDTFAEMNRMREHWQRIEPTPESHGRPTAWVPAVDIYARGADIVIRCELAGVSKDDVDVSLSDGTLSIWGERTDDPSAGEGVSFYVRERRYGPFRRSIDLPRTIDRDRISARFVDGLLEITIAGGADPREPDRIEIAVADGGEVEVDVGGA